MLLWSAVWTVVVILINSVTDLSSSFKLYQEVVSRGLPLTWKYYGLEVNPRNSTEF